MSFPCIRIEVPCRLYHASEEPVELGFVDDGPVNTTELVGCVLLCMAGLYMIAWSDFMQMGSRM